MFSDALNIALSPFLWAFQWAYLILSQANAFHIFMALFASSVVSRLLIRPLIGDAVAIRTTERRSKKLKERNQQAKQKGND